MAYPKGVKRCSEKGCRNKCVPDSNFCKECVKIYLDILPGPSYGALDGNA